MMSLQVTQAPHSALNPREMTLKIPGARLLAPHYPTLLVREEEVGAEEGGEDADFRPVEDGGPLVSEVRGCVDVGEEPVGPLLPQLRHQRLPPPLLLPHMLLTASPSKGQRPLIPLRLPRGPVRSLLVLEILPWRDTVIYPIQSLDTTVRLVIHLLSRVQRIVQQDLLRYASAVSNRRRLRHDRFHHRPKTVNLLNLSCP